MEVNINVNASESLLKALDMLVKAVEGLKGTNIINTEGLVTPLIAPEVSTPKPQAEPATPVTTEPKQQAEPVTPEPQQVQAVPVTPISYTTEQLALAASQLIDTGKRDGLVALLGKFGVQALTDLPSEQYGAFATELRQMGANL